MYTLRDGNARKLHYALSITEKELKEFQAKYKNGELTNVEAFNIYHEWIVQNAPYPKNKSWEETWKKHTKAQKSLNALGVLIGQTNNGGISQVFFNYPNYVLLIADVIYDELKMYIHTGFGADYEKALKDFFSSVDDGSFNEIMSRWNDQNIAYEKRWSAFQDFKKKISTHEKIRDYFYTDDFKKGFYDRIIRYIEKNINMLLKVVPEEVSTSITKKNAIPHFTNYLKTVYQKEPKSVSIHYSKKVTIDSIEEPVFLMAYELADGTKSIGVTGVFTYHLEGITLDDIETMKKTKRNQALVNIYHGYHLAQEELKKNPKAMTVDTEKWEKLIARFQNPKKARVPVNVKFHSYYGSKNETFYFFHCGLVDYNHQYLPEDYSKSVEIVPYSERNKKKNATKCAGVLDTLIMSTGKVQDYFRYAGDYHNIYLKYPVFCMLGTYYKLL